jgi:hypothetical protein
LAISRLLVEGKAAMIVRDKLPRQLVPEDGKFVSEAD